MEQQKAVTWLNTLPLEINSVDKLRAPKTDREAGDIPVTIANDFLKKLYSLLCETEEFMEVTAVKLKYQEVEEDTAWDVELAGHKARLLVSLFWYLAQLELAHFPITRDPEYHLVITKDWEFVARKQNNQPPKFLKFLFGGQ